MPDPLILYDFDVLLTSGHRELFSVQQGRDTIGMDESRIRLELHDSPTTTTEVILERKDIAILKVTKTEVPRDASIVEALEAGTYVNL